MTRACKVLETTEANLDLCADFLRSGDVVGVPTETVYGLAGNALNEPSVRKIFEVKGRPLIDPLIVHFASLQAAEAHVEFNDRARELAARFWPGALTMVLPKRASISDLITAGLPSVAIRVPGHPVFHQLLEGLEFPWRHRAPIHLAMSALPWLSTSRGLWATVLPRFWMVALANTASSRPSSISETRNHPEFFAPARFQPRASASRWNRQNPAPIVALRRHRAC